VDRPPAAHGRRCPDDRLAAIEQRAYRGRLAPSPTAHLHLGHARTFWAAQQRARENNGVLVLRNEDLDRVRSKAEFVRAMVDDLRWFGLQWNEGPDCGGPFAPYNQSERFHLYRAALERLRASGFIYPCTCSRKDIQHAAQAPHAADDEAIYPGTRSRCGSSRGMGTLNCKGLVQTTESFSEFPEWRLRAAREFPGFILLFLFSFRCKKRQTRPITNA